MTAFTIYPAIDLRHGEVVRLQQGDPERLTRFSNDPAAAARRWLDAGATWLHVVNLDGAFGDSDDRNRSAIQAILAEARRSNARVQLGGGIRTLEDIQAALDLGAERIILGTLAVEQPETLADAIHRFGPDRIAAGVDARDGLVKVRGWQQTTQKSALELAEELLAFGLAWLIFTDIARDGLEAGLNIASTLQLTRLPGLNVIASGGVQDIRDIERARHVNCKGVIVGRALYDGQMTIHQWEYP